MKLSTLNTIINSFNVTSKDETRYQLTFVMVERGNDNELTVTAADGYRASRITLNDDCSTYFELDKKYFVSKESLPALKMLAKEFKRIAVIPCRKSMFGVELYTETLTVKIEQNQSVNYPSVNAVWPNNVSDETHYTIGIDADLLASLAAALLDPECKGKTQVKLQINKESKMSPIVVSIHERQGVIMPCRV